MSARGRRIKDPNRLPASTATALLGVLGALCVLWEAMEEQQLFVGNAVALILVALAMAWWTIRVEVIRAKDPDENVLNRVVLSRSAPGRAPRFDELTPYRLGADEHGSAGKDGPIEYLPRDRDGDLRTALATARQAQAPQMIVLSGPSKSGKSRTLYEAVASDPVLCRATVLAPRNLQALAAILGDGRPAPASGPVLLWLDDLERFVSAGHAGMNRDALDELAKWRQPVVVVATAGGKAADLPLSDGRTLQELYNHGHVVSFPLRSALSSRERAEVAKRFDPEVAQAVNTHGIGEYLVAGPALASKLVTERHAPGEPECREGAAVAWAAIDWARGGMTRPIPKAVLRSLWPCYLDSLPATDKRFEDGLEWALRPVFRSVALLRESNSYEPYDWIVGYADSELDREINPDALGRIVELLESEAGLDTGVAGEQNPRGSDRRAPAADTFKLGRLLEARGDVAGAARAYRTSMELGVGIDSARAALNLGALRAEQSDVDGARAAYERAQASDDATLACQASFQLGKVLLEHGDPGACDALERALRSPDPDIAGASGSLLTALREQQAALSADEARAELRRAYTRERDKDFAGAETTYRTVIEHGPYEFAARAAFGLGELLATRSDHEGAQEAYEWAIATEVEAVVPAAWFGLGELLMQRGDLAGARAAFEHAAEAANPTIADAAKKRLEELT